MGTLERSQHYVPLKELVADDEQDELYFDIVEELGRALNTGDRILDQTADEADDQKGPESTEGQQLDAEAQKLADRLDELW
ncbi:hypothetical protein F52700_12731 [Fusarium sp. NRRL 52700]|nr:hypothetical protein F52700_12731 [Fusarium sp. NRRL 52700]